MIRKLAKIINRINQEEQIKLCYSQTKSKGTFYPEAKVFNFSGGDILIGSNTHIRGELLTLGFGGKITIGENCFLGEGSKVWSGENVEIGNNVLISHGVNIIDSNTHELDAQERMQGFRNLIKHGQPKEKGSILTSPIIINDDVWISFNAIILKGVTIGKGAIVAAGSVVTRDVPPHTLVAGNPSQEIKQLN